MSPLDRNLHALATCYRIGAGLLGIGLSLLFLLLMSGNALSGSLNVGALVFGLLLLAVGGVVVYQLIEVATSLEHHERRTFCLVVAWLACAAFPLGTVLGVFTLLQLIQPAAELAFAEAENQDAADLRPHPGHPAEG